MTLIVLRTTMFLGILESVLFISRPVGINKWTFGRQLASAIQGDRFSCLQHVGFLHQFWFDRAVFPRQGLVSWDELGDFIRFPFYFGTQVGGPVILMLPSLSLKYEIGHH